MPRPLNPRTRATSVNESELASPASEAAASALSLDQIRRWAALIVEGRDEVPVDLDAFDRERLQDEVRRQLRDRLVRLVARAIAVQLHREFGKKVEDDCHA